MVGGAGGREGGDGGGEREGCCGGLVGYLGFGQGVEFCGGEVGGVAREGFGGERGVEVDVGCVKVVELGVVSACELVIGVPAYSRVLIA